MRTSLAFLAGAWVLLVAGCTDMTGFLVMQGGAPEDRVLVGSLDAPSGRRAVPDRAHSVRVAAQSAHLRTIWFP